MDQVSDPIHLRRYSTFSGYTLHLPKGAETDKDTNMTLAIDGTSTHHLYFVRLLQGKKDTENTRF